jgi:hypothetical protein
VEKACFFREFRSLQQRPVRAWYLLSFLSLMCLTCNGLQGNEQAVTMYMLAVNENPSLRQPGRVSAMKRLVRQEHHSAFVPHGNKRIAYGHATRVGGFRCPLALIKSLGRWWTIRSPLYCCRYGKARRTYRILSMTHRHLQQLLMS